MRTALLLAVLFGLTAAIPRPQDELEPSEPEDDDSDDTDISSDFLPTLTSFVIPATTLSISITATPIPLPSEVVSSSLSSTSRRRNPHKEPIPILTKKCECENLATVAYPCWAKDKKSRCIFEYNHSYACHMRANGGCPSPTIGCTQYSEEPLTGKHPCDLSPNTGFPKVTTAPVVTANVTAIVIATSVL